MKPVNVISCFDGISCGRLALERAGIPVDKYFAFEIDKYAIKIAEKRNPNIVSLGSIKGWKFFDQLPEIDYLLAGFPCQSYSIAGNRMGLEDIRGQLLYDLLAIIDYYRPKKKLLLENVKGFLTSNNGAAHRLLMETLQQMGYNMRYNVLNSSLVSAQNRERVYYTNWDVQAPKDKGILLKDIVMDGVFPVALHNLYGGFKEKAVRVSTDKSPTIRTAGGGGHIPSLVKESLIHSEKAIEYMNRTIHDGRTHWDFGLHSDIKNPKLATLVANLFKGVPYNVFKDWDCIRKLHPVECERLQTLPDGYTESISDTQRYKTIGNGWTVDMVSEILKQSK